MAHQEKEGKTQDEASQAPNLSPSCGEGEATVIKINDILPNELLAYIFATAISSLRPMVHRFFLTQVCRICRRWRDVAIEASDLWTAIYIHDEDDLPAAKLFLRRSKTQLLDVDVDIRIGNSFGVDARFALWVAELTSVHLEHTRALSLVVRDALYLEPFVKLYRPMSTPHLVSLSADIPGWSQSISPLLDSIRSVNSNGSDGLHYNETSISILTRLELACSPLEQEDLRNIFTYFPSLETLILQKFARRRSENQEGHPMMLAPSSLRSLAIYLNFEHGGSLYPGDDSPDCSCVFGSLSFQNLEYLEILGERYSSNLNFGSHFKDLPKLKTLRLQRCPVPPLDDKFFRSMKLLNHLELVDNLSCVKWLTESSPTKTTLPFPHLSSISLSDRSSRSHDMTQWARLARVAVQNSGCNQFSIKVTTQHYHRMMSALGPQDEHIRVETEEYHPHLHRLLPGNAGWSDDDDVNDDYLYHDRASDFDGYVSSD